jgi:hypothetical protein
VHAQFNILPPSANASPHFGGLIGFDDADVSIASAADIPGTGAFMGRVDSVATFGIANEGCNTQTPITFNLIEAETATTAGSFTNGGPMTVGGGGLPPAAAGTNTDFTYVHPLNPLGLKENTNGVSGYQGGPGLGPAAPGPTQEGNRLVAVNEISVDSEELLVVGVDYPTKQYRVIRGWNGTVPAPHLAGAEVKRVNVIYPNGPGSNLLANLGEDDGDLDNNGTAEGSANSIPDGADAVASFVRNSLDPNVQAQDGGSVQARARYLGVAYVANSLIVILQLVIMDPGAFASPIAPFPGLEWATSAWGYPSVTFLQDPQAPPSDSAITDFCNFTSNTFLYGVTHDNACTGASPPVACTGSGAGFTLRLAVDGGCPGITTPNECGSVRLRTPSTTAACGGQAAGWSSCSLRFYEYAMSQRDYDNDGIENSLDTCPTNPNPSWDPRAPNALSGGDADGDGLPAACDPNDGVSNADQDADGGGTGWFNRGDNCPTVSNTAPIMTNPNQLQYDQDVPPGQYVPDGGPPSDGIGPECDPNPTFPNGHYHATYAAETICIGAAANQCSDTLDDDDDGVVNSRDTCIGGFNPPTGFPGPAGQDTMTVAVGAGASTITVGSTAGFTVGSPIMIGWPAGFGTRETLRYITGIGPNTIAFSPPVSRDHPAGTDVRQVAFAQSIRDLNNDGYVDQIGDISKMSGRFNTQGGNPQGNTGNPPNGNYVARFDLNNDSFIDVIGDIQRVAGVYGAACGPPTTGP